MIPQIDETNRAPNGVCEIALEAFVSDPERISAKLQRALRDMDVPSVEVYPYKIREVHKSGRVSIRTGADRLNIEDLRDLGELIAGADDYKDGNIPPGVNIIPLTGGESNRESYIWFEFELKSEAPREDVELRIRDFISNRPVQPKRPTGKEDMASIYRVGSVSYSPLRDVTNMGTNIRDELDTKAIRLVCETG